MSDKSKRQQGARDSFSTNRNPDKPVEPCPLNAKLVALRVIEGATAEGCEERSWGAVVISKKTRARLDVIAYQQYDKGQKKEPYARKEQVISELRRDSVVVEAETEPNDPAIGRHIQWEDAGDAIEGNPLRRRLSKEVARHYQVKATLNQTTLTIHVLIMEAAISMAPGNKRPGDAAPVEDDYYIGDVLGSHTPVVGQSVFGISRIIPVGSITPRSVDEHILENWTFHREYFAHDYRNGSERLEEGNYSNAGWNTEWIPDDSNERYQMLMPTKKGEIYDFDELNVFFSDRYQRMERYINFRQWVSWNGVCCSDYFYWHYVGCCDVTMSDDPTSPDRIVENRLQEGHIKLPDTAQADPGKVR